MLPVILLVALALMTGIGTVAGGAHGYHHRDLMRENPRGVAAGEPIELVPPVVVAADVALTPVEA